MHTHTDTKMIYRFYKNTGYEKQWRATKKRLSVVTMKLYVASKLDESLQPNIRLVLAKTLRCLKGCRNLLSWGLLTLQHFHYVKQASKLTSNKDSNKIYILSKYLGYWMLTDFNQQQQQQQQQTECNKVNHIVTFLKQRPNSTQPWDFFFFFAENSDLGHYFRVTIFTSIRSYILYLKSFPKNRWVLSWFLQKIHPFVRVQHYFRRTHTSKRSAQTQSCRYRPQLFGRWSKQGACHKHDPTPEGRLFPLRSERSHLQGEHWGLNDSSNVTRCETSHHRDYLETDEQATQLPRLRIRTSWADFPCTFQATQYFMRIWRKCVMFTLCRRGWRAPYKSLQEFHHRRQIEWYCAVAQ